MTVFLDPVIETIVNETDGELVVRSPRVGIYRHGPRPGLQFSEGDAVETNDRG